jgi:uncharacterized membrane protein YkvA (DUF1232 family)
MSRHHALQRAGASSEKGAMTTGFLALKRAMADARTFGAALADPRSGYGSKLVLAVGLAYPWGPIDLIPNSLPVVGYLDQVAFVVGGIALSYLLLPAAPELARGKTEYRWLPAPSAMRARLAAWLRAAVLDSFAGLFARPILRLAIGAWPAPAEVAVFRAAFRRFTPLPPLLRGLAMLPAGRHQLTRAMLASWLLADESYRGHLRAELLPEPSPGAAPAGNCLRIWTGQKVTFLHLEKTAGMAVTEVLAAQFHPLQIDADLRRAFPPHVLTPLPPFLLPQVRRCALVWGHYDVPSIRRLGEGRFSFTLLREPKARILSLYRYWRGQAALDLGWNGMNQPVLAAQRLSLAAFLATDDPWILDYIDNFYVRRLTGQYCSFGGRDPLRAAPEEWRARALQELARFDFVGLTEDTAGSMSRLADMLGFPAPARVPRVNVTQADDNKTVANDPAVAAALDRLTWLDQTIYAAAVQHYRA